MSPQPSHEEMMRYLIALSLVVAGCSSSPVAPTPQPVPSFPSSLRAEASCSAPTNVWVGQTQGRTDITWDGSADKFLVWLEVEDHNVYVSVEGAPATADSTRYEVYLPEGGIYAVRVQPVCGDSYGPFSESVVFGGRSGPVVVPPPPVEPPACGTLRTTGHPNCTGGGCGNECPR